MQVIFRGDPGELARGGGLSRTSIDMYGHHFAMGAPVDVSGLSEAQKAKLANHNHFEVVSEQVAAMTEAQGAEGAPPADDGDAEAREAAELAARLAAKKAAKKAAKA